MASAGSPGLQGAAVRWLRRWGAVAVLVILAGFLDARWLSIKPEAIRHGIFSGLEERASLLPLLQAGLATCLAAGAILLRLLARGWRLPAPLLAALFLLLTGAFLEWALRQHAWAQMRPSPTLIWELDPKGPENNRWGMRYPDFPATPQPSEFRFLVLGDSSAWGDGLERVDQRFSDLVESRLRQAFPHGVCRVMNAAVPGYSTFQMAAALDQKYLALQPDCLILATNSDWPRESAPDRQRLPSPWLRPLLALLDTSEVYLCLVSSMLEPGPSPADSRPPGPRVPEPESRTNLEAMIRAVQARGGCAVVLNMPVYLERYRPGESIDMQPRYLHSWRRQARAAAHSTGSPFLDLDTEWRLRHGADLDPLFLDLVHPSPRGHQDIADRLYPVLCSVLESAGTPPPLPAAPLP
ncbi:MAG: SGNH/GDSL hydrolase family protein [Candidatus Xenobium sp.]